MYLFFIALASLKNRLFTAILTILTIALSVCLLLAVERIRTEAKNSFASTISGTDLVVGARSGSVNLLLYSVFRIGNATNNIRWSSYQEISQLPQVKWTIPLSLGDSHKGYRVLATNKDYFNYYRYGHKQLLHLAKGQVFNDVFDVVLGSEVAKALNYNIGDKIILAHGVSLISLANHNDKPFKVVGILTQTGTPVDRTLHISLAGMEAIHIDWQKGTSPPTKEHALEQDRVKQLKLKPQQITAFLLGLKSKIATFTVQRKINNYIQEPLLAILPGVALQELWSLMSVAEKALLIVSLFVILTGLVGMLTSILTGLNERRREMAILRSVGATPWHILYLMLMEAFILGFVGIVMGLIILYSTIFACQTWVQAQYGLYLPLGLPSYYELRLLAGILIASATVGLIPAWHAYRQSLIDGLSIKI